jgi:hypothetical protein
MTSRVGHSRSDATARLHLPVRAFLVLPISAEASRRPRRPALPSPQWQDTVFLRASGHCNAGSTSVAVCGELVTSEPDGEEDPSYCPKCVRAAIRWCAQPVPGDRRG